MYDMNSFPVKGGKNVCCSATFGLYLIMLTISGQLEITAISRMIFCPEINMLETLFQNDMDFCHVQ